MAIFPLINFNDYFHRRNPSTFHSWKMIPTFFLPPANEVCEGYVFTPVCQSFCSWGGGTWAGTLPPGQVPPRQVHPPGRYTPSARYTPSGQVHPRHVHPQQCMLGYGQQAGGTNPNGKHSCSFIKTLILTNHSVYLMLYRLGAGKLLIFSNINYFGVPHVGLREGADMLRYCSAKHHHLSLFRTTFQYVFNLFLKEV